MREYFDCKRNIERALHQHDYETAQELLGHAFELQQQAGVRYTDDLLDYTHVICAESLLQMAKSNYSLSERLTTLAPDIAGELLTNTQELATRIQQSALDLGVQLSPKAQKLLEEILLVQ
jgi:hypothetical protein